jgi:hypothetical protein
MANDNDQDLGQKLRHALGLLTEEDLASMLNLKSVATLATWRSDGKGPVFTKLGKGVFYRTGDVVNWITQNCVPPSLSAAA